MGQDNHLEAKSGETCFLSFFTNLDCIPSTKVAEDPRSRASSGPVDRFVLSLDLTLEVTKHDWYYNPNYRTS